MRWLAILTALCISLFALRSESSQSLGQVFNDNAESQLDQLRERYISLVEEKIESWSKEELQHGINEVRTDLADLEARTLLKQAVEILGRIVDDFPQTPSAQRANRMLTALRMSKRTSEDDPNTAYLKQQIFMIDAKIAHERTARQPSSPSIRRLVEQREQFAQELARLQEEKQQGVQ